MMSRKRQIIIAGVLLVGLAGIGLAQFGGGGGRRRGGGFSGAGPGIAPPRNGVQEWPVDPAFKKDVFTFVRVQYSARGRPSSWETDYPDSDLNFSFRLQQLTSLKVNPVPEIVTLTDERMFDYPFLYMLETGGLDFMDDEVTNLRRYLLNGGFLMVDDHWGDNQYENTHEQLLRVLPGNEPVELPLSHPIFHCVFDLKELPQIPGIDWARRMRNSGSNNASENYSGPARYRAIFDDKGRIMVLICSNTDLGDGWEREGAEEWYFHQFSEKLAYPMGINIVFWAMTH